MSETNVECVDEEYQEKAGDSQWMCIVRNAKLIREKENYRAGAPNNSEKYGQLSRKKKEVIKFDIFKNS